MSGDRGSTEKRSDEAGDTGACGNGKSMKLLFLITALAEGATGLALLAVPAQVVALLLGAPIEIPAAITVARLAGVALLSIGILCAVAVRMYSGEMSAALAIGLAAYNVLAAVVLAHARIVLGLTSVLLWPAVLMHVAMAGWCAVCVRASRSAGIDST